MKTKAATRFFAFLEACLLLLLSLPLSALATVAEDVGSGFLPPHIDVLDRFRGPAVHDTLPDLPLSGNPQIEGLIETACAEHGYSYQSDGTTKYGIWFGLPTAAWCAMFISWCADRVGIPTGIIAKMATTDASWYAENGTLHYFFEPWLDNRMQNTIKEHGIYCSREEYTPKRGDLIYIKWSDSGYSTTFAHVGIVCGVKDGRVYTVEGNSGTGMVRYKSYELTSTVIRAYATPNYTPTEPYKTGFYEVRAGAGLNLRAEASTASPLLATIPNKTLLRISEVKDNAWGRTSIDGVEGWVSLAYTKHHSDIPVIGLGGPTTVYAPLGFDFTSQVSIIPYDATSQALTYSSSDESILTVQPNGRVTPLAQGNATLTVSCPEGFTLSVSVTVTAPTERGSFSEWITVLPPAPDNAERITEQKEVYRFRTYHLLTSDIEQTLEGYLFLGAETLYTDWSDPITSKEPPTPSQNLELISQKSYYTYFHYHNTYENGSRGIDSIPTGIGEEIYEEVTINYALPESTVPDKGGKQSYRHDDHNCPDGWRVYFLKEAYTEYTYRTRESKTVYRYLLETPWSDWQEAMPEEAEHQEVETLTFTRYFDNEVLSIELITPPAITEAHCRTELDTTGLTFKVHYLDGSEKILDQGFTLSGYDPESEGMQTVTLHYLGQTLTFPVTFTDPNPIQITASEISGVWRSELVQAFDIINNHGLISYRILLTYDPAAMTPISFTSPHDGNHTLTISEPGKAIIDFASPTQIRSDGLLFSLTWCVNREAALTRYPIALAFDPEATFRLTDKPIRMVMNDSALTVLPEEAHTYQDTVETPPTCTAEGVLRHTCVTCDHTYTEPIASLPHTFGSPVIEKQPTCTEEGLKATVCTGCGLRSEEAIAKLPHTFTDTVEKQPTCTEEGLKATVCTGCGLRSEEAIAKLPHTFTETVEKQPTCTEEGLKATVCTGCDQRSEEAIAKLPHTFTETVEKQPTCTEEGLKATVCEGCGQRSEASIPPLGHTYGSKTTVTAPTCTEEGSEHQICAVCAHSAVSPIPALGHTYTSVIVPPTKRDDGYTEHTCSRCRHAFRDHITEALGYVITFLDHDGTVLMSYGLKYGQSVTKPAGDPFREASVDAVYTFQGWQGYLDGMTVSEDLTFTALYLAEARQYHIIFKDEDGNLYRDEHLPYGAPILPPESTKHPEDPYYTFDFTGFDTYKEGMTVKGDATFLLYFTKEAKYPSHIESGVFEIDREAGTVTGISQKTTVDSLISSMEGSAFLTVFKGSAPLSGSDTVGSGMTVAIVGDSGIVSEMTLIVTGDVSGDGKLTLTDYVRVKSHLLGKSPLEGVYLKAADLNGDGKTTLTDYVKMKSILLGKS